MSFRSEFFGLHNQWIRTSHSIRGAALALLAISIVPTSSMALSDCSPSIVIGSGDDALTFKTPFVDTPDHGGFSLIAPKLQPKSVHINGHDVTARYHWVHVATIGTQSATGSLSVEYDKGTNTSDEIASTFAVTIGMSQGISAGAKGIGKIGVKLKESFGYSETQAKALATSAQNSDTTQVPVAAGTATQVWQLAVTYRLDNGLTLTQKSPSTLVVCQGIPLKFDQSGSRLQSKFANVTIGTIKFPFPTSPPKDHENDVPPSASAMSGSVPVTIKPKKLALRAYFEAGAVESADPIQVMKWSGCSTPGSSVSPKPHAILDMNTNWGWPSINNTYSYTQFSDLRKCLKLLDAQGQIGTSAFCATGLPKAVGAHKNEAVTNCENVRVLAAGGCPTMFTNRCSSGTKDVTAAASWSPVSSVISNGPSKKTIKFVSGVTSSKSATKAFSASIGLEVEGEANFGVVSISESLSASFDASTSHSTGLSVSTSVDRTYDFDLADGLTSQFWQLNVNYQAGNAKLINVSNVILELDSSPIDPH